MPELEQQLQRLAAAVLDDVEPVTAEEAAGRGGRRSPHRLALVALGVAAAVALVAAVLAVRDDTHTVDTVGPGGGRTISWADLLALVPDTPETRSSLRIGDPARYLELAGRPPLGPAASDEDLGELPLSTPLFQHEPADLRAELGFDARAVDQVVLAGRPPTRTEILRGRFDREAMAAAVAADPVWSPLLEERVYAGVEFWSWGADYELNAVFSPLRGPGESARLALVDDVAVWAGGDPELEAVLDAVAGRTGSLADDPDHVLAAEEADRRSMVEGEFWVRADVLAQRAQGPGMTSCVPSPCPPDPEPLPEEHVPLVQLSGSAVAPGGGDLPVAVLVYPDEEAATAATDPVRRALDARGEHMAGQDPDVPVDEDVAFEVVGRALVVVGSTHLFFPL